MLLLSVLVLAACLALFLLVWTATGTSRSMITPLLVFAVHEMVYVWPATIYAQTTGEARDAYPAIVAAAGFSAFLVGFAAFSAHGERLRRLLRSYPVAPVIQDHTSRSYAMTIVAASLLFGALSLYLYQGVPPLARGILAVLSGEDRTRVAAQVSMDRYLVTKAYMFGGAYRGQGVLLETVQTAWPYLFVLACLLYRRRKSTSWLLTAGLMFIAMITFSCGSGARLPVVMTFLYLLIAWSMLKKPNWRHMVAGCLAIFVVFCTVSLLDSGSSRLPGDGFVQGLLSKSLWRIFLGSGIHNVQVIEFVRDGTLVLGLGSIHAQKLVAALPGPGGGEPFSYKLQMLIKPGSPRPFFASMTYLGILYADFGLAGVLLGYCLLGAAAALMQSLLFQTKKTLLTLPAVAFVVLYWYYNSISNVVSFSASVFIVLVVYSILKLMLVVQTPQSASRGVWAGAALARPCRVNWREGKMQTPAGKWSGR